MSLEDILSKNEGINQEQKLEIQEIVDPISNEKQ